MINGVNSFKDIQETQVNKMKASLHKMKTFIAKNNEFVKNMVEGLSRENKVQNDRKMWQFCDNVLKEFRYLNKKLEDRIYLELGYVDKVEKENPHFVRPADIDDLVSEIPMSSMSWARDESPRPRSIGVFKRKRTERRFGAIEWGEVQRLATPKVRSRFI